MLRNGKQIAGEVLDELRHEVSDKKLRLKMAAILVGDDPGLKKFVDNLSSCDDERFGVDWRDGTKAHIK